MRDPALVLVLALALGLAGCVNGGQSTTEGDRGWTYSAGGQGNADESGRLDVPSGQVRATLSVGGQASIHLIVSDADGDVVLRLDCSGSGGCSKDRVSPRGTPGTWSTELKGLYNGGVSATVRPT